MVIDNTDKTRHNQVNLKILNDCKYFDVIVETMGRLSDISTNFKKFSSQRKGKFQINLNHVFKFIKFNILKRHFNNGYNTIQVPQCKELSAWQSGLEGFFFRLQRKAN